MRPSLHTLLDRVTSAERPDCSDLVTLLGLTNRGHVSEVLAWADRVRRDRVGDEILLRGIVEFSSVCCNSCFYCGLRAQNVGLNRYRMSAHEILEAVGRIAAHGVKTVVLQSGEDPSMDAAWLAEVIRRIKSEYDAAITLSVGERDESDYRLWRQAGADRYLLKIETSDKALYEAVHADRSFDRRLACSLALKRLGYENGSGIIVGLPGQTVEGLARDLLFLKDHGFDMVSVGVFIPHQQTPFAGQPQGDLDLALRVIALARIVTGDTHIPAATALGTAAPDGQVLALQAGANVVMPNFTPAPYRALYEIYPNKRCLNEPISDTMTRLNEAAELLGRPLGFVKGSSLKKTPLQAAK